jgi:DNA uptake protein ComE-like DNA-binding protein
MISQSRSAAKVAVKTRAVTVIAALGLSILSPAQWVMTGVALGAVAMATPAWAQAAIPGVGLVIKKKPGNAPIVAPSDNNGVIRLSGLEPGDYEVSLIGESSPTHVKVGRDGVLTARAVMSDDGKDRSIEDLTGKDVKADTFDLKALFAYDRPNVPRAMRGQPPARPMGPHPRFVDVNASSADEITKFAPTTSPDAAQFIVGEREKNGAYKDPIDFANRVCSKASVDFGFAPTLIGNAQIVARGSNPKDPGFKCAPAPRGADPTFELYGKQHSYVGHVTLLR